MSFNYSRKPKDFVCKVLKFENKYHSKLLLRQKLICQCLCCSTQEIACICAGCSVNLNGFLHFFCYRKVDQLTYDLRHLKTGFNNYKHRKMMKVTWNCVWNLTLSDCFGKQNKTFVVIYGRKLLKLFSWNCYWVFVSNFHSLKLWLSSWQEQEEKEREELLNRRFTANVSFE